MNPQDVIHKAKTSPDPQSEILALHETLCYLAEPIVQHFWTDIAVHDKNILASAPKNSSFIWVVHKCGSYLCPLYSSLLEIQQQIRKARKLIEAGEPMETQTEYALKKLPLIVHLRNRDVKEKDLYQYFYIFRGDNKFNFEVREIDSEELD